MDPTILFRDIDPIVTNHILRLLKTHQGVIAGSFAVRGFLPDFPFNDIDIFLPESDITEASKLEAKWQAQNLAFQVYGWTPIDEKRLDIYNDPYNLNVSGWRAAGVNIHIIRVFVGRRVGNLNIRDMIINKIRMSSDFDGCSSIFDGERLWPPMMDEKNFVEGRWRIQPFLVQSLYESIHRTSPTRMNRFLDRVQKYQSRGVAFVNLSAILKPLRDVHPLLFLHRQ